MEDLQCLKVIYAIKGVTIYLLDFVTVKKPVNSNAYDGLNRIPDTLVCLVFFL